MTQPIITQDEAPPPSDPYEIRFNPDSKLFDILHNGLWFDAAPDYGAADALKLLHQALGAATICGEAYPTWLEAGAAAFAQEHDGRLYRPRYCGRCQGWHVEEGR